MRVGRIVVATLAGFLGATASTLGGFIDFEYLPSGAAPVKDASIGTSYADWGITSFTGSWQGYPTFRSGQYNGQGFYAQSASAYGRTEWIDVVFSVPVTEITCDLATAPGYGVYIRPYNEQGALMGLITGGYTGGAPSSFWIRGHRIAAEQPIARLRWETGVTDVVLCLDNLQFTPDPATLALLAIGAAALGSRRRRMSAQNT